MSDPIPYPQSDDTSVPGTWKSVQFGSGGGRSATFTCPNGHWGSLFDHAIEADGTVKPSVVCPDCDFHEFIRLEGWQP